ncbi:TRAM domain-containing protein [Halorussus gelatinilyticus]|uniref:TRAM domain-containing protein n=1 Tax=Halorussus gelatinilyticus TaxID=2937524 RepID=A0A8U0IEN4_9EURY|nr:TRAM domain-containing protein [Halorussus gelatinilyticus]UPV99536.1 TRAM domain-containing protein [Halorussus gelatinilyticus]
MADRETAPVSVGERYSVEIEDLGSEGDGVARIESFVVFVPGADLGERVDIRIEEVGGSHAVASVVEESEVENEGRGSADDGEASERGKSSE